MNRRPAETPSESSPPYKMPKQMDYQEETHILENDLMPTLSCSITELPTEVMEHIFEFLCLRDRLNASLTCKKWHEVGRYPSYSQSEKLVFRGFKDFEILVSFLVKTNREILNLEFHSCRLMSSSTLSVIAAKIHYLRFFDCDLSLDIAFALFAECVNLSEFYLKDDLVRCSPNAALTCFSKQFVEDLEQRNFVNENLKILHLNLLRSDLTSRNVRSIFKMFPNLKHLTFKVFTMPGYDNDEFDPNEYYSDALFQEIVLSKNTLENLGLIASEPQLHLLARHNFTRLKEISIHMSCNIPDSLIFDFFSRQKYLERITCFILHSSSFPSRFLQHLIQECHRLKHLKLKFRVSCSIDLSPELFQSLVSSKLESLILINPDIRPTSDELFTSTNSPTNTTLRVLRIPIIIDHRMQNFFLQSFKHLQFLELQCFSGTVLESIGKFQKNLTTLKLSMVSKLPTYLSERISPASKWCLNQVNDCLPCLACLENLDLQFDNCSPLFYCKFVPSSVKYLRIHVWCSGGGLNAEEDKHSILALKEKTELEAFYFGTSYDRLIDFSIWLDLSSSLKKLRFLGVNSDACVAQRPSQQYLSSRQSLCERCPSLRFFVERTVYGDIQFEYDYVDQKMKIVDWHGISKWYNSLLPKRMRI